MKRNALFALMLGVILTFGMLLIACDNGLTDELVYNEFTVAGSTFEVFEGGMIYYGNYDSNDAVVIDLWLNGDELKMNFDLYVSNDNDRLVAGTYNYSDQYAPLAYCKGTFEFHKAGGRMTATGGTVKVAVSGSGDETIYTITINGTYTDDEGNAVKSLEGTYRGTLEWEDWT